MNRAPGFCGLILAAGASSRMGRDKALLPWHGTTFVESAMQAFRPLCDLIIVVAGANAERLQPVVDGAGAYLAVNPNPERGQFSSLRIGLQEVLNRGRDAALVTLVDRPAAAIETIRALQQAFVESPAGTWAVVPQFEERHGHPIIVGREMIEAFLRAAPDATASPRRSSAAR